MRRSARSWIDKHCSRAATDSAAGHPPRAIWRDRTARRTVDLSAGRASLRGSCVTSVRENRVPEVLQLLQVERGSAAITRPGDQALANITRGSMCPVKDPLWSRPSNQSIHPPP